MRATTDDRLSVLMVEDDADIAAMYKLKLELDGYQVEIAGDGSTALRAAENSAPDIIFLDLELPDMHGFDVLQKLRSNSSTAHVPVLILTNHSEPELQERGLQLGAREFLIKGLTTPAAASARVADRHLHNRRVAQ